MKKNATCFGCKDSAQAFYDAMADNYDSRFHSPVARIENSLVTAKLPTCNVLDLGCGTGLYLEYCQPKGSVGLDISEGMLAVARAKFPFHRFMTADMSAIPLPDASVDGVISLFGSFSYCLTPHRCVDEIGRVLRPNGTAFIMAMGQRYINRQSHIAPHLPFWTYTQRQLRQLLEPIGHPKIRGLNVFCDALGWLPMPLLRSYARVEHATISRLLPNAGNFLIVEVTPCPKGY